MTVSPTKYAERRCELWTAGAMGCARQINNGTFTTAVQRLGYEID
jgi:hypothetical protein